MTNFKRIAPTLASFIFLLTLTARAQTLSEAAPGAEKAEASSSSAPTLFQTIVGEGKTGRLARFNGPYGVLSSLISEWGDNVGIGTESPAKPLEIASPGGLRLSHSSGDIDFTEVADLTAWTTTGSPNPNEPALRLHAGAGVSRIFTVLNNGNVGVGTGSPTRPLEIANGQLRLTSAHGDLEFTEIADLVSHVTSPSPAGDSPALRVIVGTNLAHVFTVFNDGDAKVAGTLEVGGGSCNGCSPPSDRSLKANLSAVNPRFILDKLASVPVQTWNYKSEPESVRHIGPMAQDFRAAFNLGADDRTLNTVDAQGVTMASVQALYQMMLEKERQIEALTREVEQQQAQLDQLRRTIGRNRAEPKRQARAR